MEHLPRRLSGMCSFFLQRGATISCTVTGGEKILHRSVHCVDSHFRVLYCAQQRMCYRTVNYCCFDYCQLIFVSLIFVALLPYENILTTKFSQVTVGVC